jgi:hypothetical protein
VKIITAALIVTAFAAVAHAEKPTDMSKITAGQKWVSSLLDPKAVAPTKATPVDYVVYASASKLCRGLDKGTAKDDKALAKLKACLVDTFDDLAQGHAEAEWSEVPANSVAKQFAKKYVPIITTGAKGKTVVAGHFDVADNDVWIYVALDDKQQVHAVWTLINATD